MLIGLERNKTLYPPFKMEETWPSLKADEIYKNGGNTGERGNIEVSFEKSEKEFRA